MASYSVSVWVTPIKPIRFLSIEAASLDKAWEEFFKRHPQYTEIEKVNAKIKWTNYNGLNGRVYRRKVKLTRL